MVTSCRRHRVGAVELEPDAVAGQRGAHQRPGAVQPQAQPGPEARVVRRGAQVLHGGVDGVEAATAGHHEERPALADRQRPAGVPVERADGHSAQVELATSGVDRGRVRGVRAAGQPDLGDVATEGQRGGRGQHDRRGEVRLLVLDREPVVGHEPVQRGERQRATGPLHPPGQPALGEQVDRQRPNDDQPIRAAVSLPGRPGPLAGRGQPGGAHLGQRRRALLLLGQRVLRLLLRRGVLASLPLAVDGGLLLRLVRGLVVLSGLLRPGPWSPWRRCRRTAPARRLRRPRTAARRRPPPRARHPATPHGHPDVPLPVFASPHPFAIRPHLDRTRLRGMTAGALTRLSECAAHYTAQRELTCRRVGPSAPYRRVRGRPRARRTHCVIRIGSCHRPGHGAFCLT